MSEKRIPVPLRAREFGGAAPRWMGWATFAVLLALWEMAVRAGWISRTFIASPAEIIVQLQNLLLSGELWLHLGASLRRLLIERLHGGRQESPQTEAVAFLLGERAPLIEERIVQNVIRCHDDTLPHPIL